MPARFSSDLEILDYLELFNSTVAVSSLLGISQSTCSRRYRVFSEQYDLGFDRVNHLYSASRNQAILQHLRQAAQRLRVRHGRVRSVRGWQLGAAQLPSLRAAGLDLPRRPMNSWTVLSLLDQRLIDVAVMGISEFQAQLPDSLPNLSSRRYFIGANIACIPVCCWQLRLIARDDHPLRALASLEDQDLSHFPSPALPIGEAPLLMASLQAHGLATQLCGLREYGEEQWEGFAREASALSYASPLLLPGLETGYGLTPLVYRLPVTECLAVVGHRDLLSDQVFASLFKLIQDDLHQVLAPFPAAIQWLR